LFLLCALWVVASSAFAHDAGISGIKIFQRQHDYVVSAFLHRTSLEQAEKKTGMSKREIEAAVGRRLHLKISGEPVVNQSGVLLLDEADDLITVQFTQSGMVKNFECTNRLFPEVRESKTILTLQTNGQIEQEVLIDAAHPSYPEAPRKDSSLTLALRYIQMGGLHILSGADHILFVVGLLLLGGKIKSLIKTVTAFTIAHSLTLTLSVTGAFQPSSRWIEPLIALSIVAIAYENLRPRPILKEGGPKDYRPLVAFGFGLIHGFGFAGALSEVGLQGPQLGIALATFNVGVELGQLSIILLAAPAIMWFSKKEPAKWKTAMAVGSVIIGLIGSVWFIQRLM